MADRPADFGGRMKRENIQPASMHKRVVGGQVLYSHVVAVEGRRMIFVAGQLARDRDGNVVGKGDMRAQIRQVGEISGPHWRRQGRR
jgi:enamine deaminase RidA (YjgF/YER057c/UK114 family)